MMSLTLFVCCLIIALVAALDTYYSVYTMLTPTDEQNPLARWLLVKFGLEGFLGLKTFGTCLTLILLHQFFPFDPAMTLFVAIVLAVLMGLAGLYLFWHS